MGVSRDQTLVGATVTNMFSAVVAAEISRFEFLLEVTRSTDCATGV
jgi:hypothetical protein